MSAYILHATIYQFSKHDWEDNQIKLTGYFCWVMIRSHCRHNYQCETFFMFVNLLAAHQSDGARAISAASFMKRQKKKHVAEVKSIVCLCRIFNTSAYLFISILIDSKLAVTTIFLYSANSIQLKSNRNTWKERLFNRVILSDVSATTSVSTPVSSSRPPLSQWMSALELRSVICSACDIEWAALPHSIWCQSSLFSNIGRLPYKRRHAFINVQHIVQHFHTLDILIQQHIATAQLLCDVMQFGKLFRVRSVQFLLLGEWIKYFCCFVVNLKQFGSG